MQILCFFFWLMGEHGVFLLRLSDLYPYLPLIFSFRMGVAQIYCIVLLVVIGYINAAPFAKKSEGAKVKRPFCNAFTGCGRKRSDPSFKNLPIDDEQEDDGMTDDWNQFDSNYPVSSTRLWNRFGANYPVSSRILSLSTLGR